ncbi:Glycosyltransferase, GT2 family [Granulicella rosea]|uniref:Glycosyltransferase, GT2 family n=1 Tax=Granulicella rosea TaxID=474952 RepID=A0A239LD97_9BACT|nr:glycosyltransferase [Granulicella rosea]SNT27888.1 Glycosyltransferase, GT2 family [Granulicella rosea]
MSAHPRVLAVIVLYRMQAEASPAYRSLREALNALAPELRFAVALYDNSPVEHAPPEDFPCVYRHDPTNPGLAKPYNRALQLAKDKGAHWLLLLDQDTVVTPDYLEELTAAIEAVAGNAEVAAICPRLVDAGLVCSPIHPPTWGPPGAFPLEVTGIAPAAVQPFNSGALLRVDAVEAIGGFDTRFPLDYLDHATFAALQQRGGRIYLLRSALEHHLSSNEGGRTDPAFVARNLSMLDAEYRFYRIHGSATDRFLRRLRLLRAAAGRIVRRKEPGQTVRLLRAALRP